MPLHPSPTDKAALDRLTTDLYGAFANNAGHAPDLDRLHQLFLPTCTISKVVGSVTEIQGLQAFIDQRRPLLTEGHLVDFAEWETDERTWACGNVAGRCSLYAKSGVLDGIAFSTRGIKNLQFVRWNGEWRISAVAWDDERNGLQLPDAL
ncbi:hypothetical protein [Lysobacter tyrosinilyticus]